MIHGEVYCRSVSSGAFPNYDVLWTDPPWNEGMMKIFQRMSLISTGQSAGENLHDALHALFSHASVSKPMYVEFSQITYQKVIPIAESYGHKLAGVTEAMQENGKSYVILSFNTHHVVQAKQGSKNIIHTIRALKPTSELTWGY